MHRRLEPCSGLKRVSVYIRELESPDHDSWREYEAEKFRNHSVVVDEAVTLFVV